MTDHALVTLKIEDRWFARIIEWKFVIKWKLQKNSCGAVDRATVSKRLKWKKYRSLESTAWTPRK